METFKLIHQTRRKRAFEISGEFLAFLRIDLDPKKSSQFKAMKLHLAKLAGLRLDSIIRPEIPKSNQWGSTAAPKICDPERLQASNKNKLIFEKAADACQASLRCSLSAIHAPSGGLETVTRKSNWRKTLNSYPSTETN